MCFMVRNGFEKKRIAEDDIKLDISLGEQKCAFISHRIGYIREKEKIITKITREPRYVLLRGIIPEGAKFFIDPYSKCVVSNQIKLESSIYVIEDDRICSICLLDALREYKNERNKLGG